MFGGFTATMAEFDFSRSCIGGYGFSPSRRGPSAHRALRPIRRPPGSRTRSVRACQVLRPRRVVQVLALALLDICLPLHRQRRHPEPVFYRGSMAGLHVPLPTLRRHPHGCLRTARGRCGSTFIVVDCPPTPAGLRRTRVKTFAKHDRGTVGGVGQLIVRRNRPRRERDTNPECCCDCRGQRPATQHYLTLFRMTVAIAAAGILPLNSWTTWPAGLTT